MRKSVLNGLVMSTLLAIGAGASAQGFMPWSDVMKMADTDADGNLTPKEVMYFESAGKFVGFQPFMADHFKDFDTNSDGMVSAEELKAGTAKLGMSDEQTSKAFFEKQGFMPNQAN